MNLPHVDWVLDDFKTEEPQEPVCKGRLYRCRVTWYQKPSTGAYVNTVEFRPLKSLSCPGCEACGWLDDFIRESNGVFGYPECPEDFTVYRLEATHMAYDHDTGNLDPVEVGFIMEPSPDDE